MGWFRSLLQADPIMYKIAGKEYADDMDRGGLLYATNNALKYVDPAGEFVADNVGKGLGYNNSLGLVRAWGEPIGNAAGALFAGGTPIGSLVMAADDYSQGKDMRGHLMNAGMAYAGSQALSGLGSTGSTAASGADGGLAATEATQGLSSTGGAAAGQVAGESGASAANPVYTGSGDYGYGSMSSLSGSPSSTQFMTLPSSEVSAVGGAGTGLESTASQARNLSSQGLLGASSKVNYADLAGRAGNFALQQQAKAEEEARRKSELGKMQAQASMNAAAASVPDTKASVQPFTNYSPYAKFSGGFQPFSYGANIRKQNYGLLG